MTSAVVSVLDLAGAFSSNVLVLLHTQTVSRGLVYSGVEGSANCLAGSLSLSVCRRHWVESKAYVNKADALLDRIAEAAA
jgi:hypothetical protein